MCVQETAVLTWHQRLETQFAARGTYCLSCKHLAQNCYARSHRKFMLDDFVHLTNTHCGEILAALNSLNLFHCSLFF